jgi:hypothetical protein
LLASGEAEQIKMKQWLKETIQIYEGNSVIVNVFILKALEDQYASGKLNKQSM